jgi:hypothetical protein
MTVRNREMRRPTNVDGDELVTGVAAVFSRASIFYDPVDPTRLNPKENEL